MGGEKDNHDESNKGLFCLATTVVMTLHMDTRLVTTPLHLVPTHLLLKGTHKEDTPLKLSTSGISSRHLLKGYPGSSASHHSGHGGVGVGAMLAGGAAAAAAAYGAHQMSHSAHHVAHGAAYYGHGHGGHGKFKHGKFKHGKHAAAKKAAHPAESSRYGGRARH
ncbi:hypothetical protein MLD38_010436 [Melastoma candidum]|uniref:Uncharacterized protein n=1 Tax=Melastoma candidum TaxID=119954 RepID=A0ACB9QZ84_9MYRT|nr:hypothetical protein MLD38_010436 [Melastoma candidum]